MSVGNLKKSIRALLDNTRKCSKGECAFYHRECQRPLDFLFSTFVRRRLLRHEPPGPTLLRIYTQQGATGQSRRLVTKPYHGACQSLLINQPEIATLVASAKMPLITAGKSEHECSNTYFFAMQRYSSCQWILAKELNTRHGLTYGFITDSAQPRRMGRQRNTN